jgi:nitroreductase
VDIYDAISCRRSVRSFLADPVPDDVIGRVLEAARCAPSSMNMQPWKFILVRDEEIKRAVVAHCPGQDFVKEAPLLVVGCALPARGQAGQNEPSAIADVAVAFAHLSLAAAAEGLGTCWISAFEYAPVQKALHVPDDVRIVVISPLGYPTDKTVRAKHRKPVSEIVCDDTFS